jgi:hypothetical protein
MYFVSYQAAGSEAVEFWQCFRVSYQAAGSEAVEFWQCFRMQISIWIMFNLMFSKFSLLLIKKRGL